MDDHYSESIVRIKKMLISLIIIALLIPGVMIFLYIADVEQSLAELVQKITSYVGVILGAIIGVNSAIYAVFLSLNNQRKNELRKEATFKLHAINKIKELENQFMLRSFNQGIDLTNSNINKASAKYLSDFKSFYNQVMELSLQVDVDYYYNCEKLFEEVNYVIMLLRNGSTTESKIDDLRIPTDIVGNLKMFNNERASKIIEDSNKVDEELNNTKFEERQNYNLYEISFIIRAEINHKLRELANLNNEMKTQIMSIMKH